ncbi:hypothetical protein GCK32_017374 [Trichostrongylus colubriformis]|uniref:Uncharacterized protein n=1 Tax=Trichostrongylus colubriformis TaxID=6319 RepID=A0AAN8J3B4_TRICO
MLIHTNPLNNHNGTMPEERTLEYVNRPEGEMDMMIGFFLMNGICVAFFLLFGLCVIFSCLRQRPRIFRQRVKRQKKEPVVPIAPPPKFKGMVTKAIRSGALDRLKQGTADIEAAEQPVKKQLRVDQQGDQIQVHVVPSQNCGSQPTAHTSAIEEVTEADELCTKPSVVRQNLLGPLTFDDLYYT